MLQIEYMKTSELREYEKNAKIHDRPQIEDIKHSIEAFGMNDPIAIWKNNVIIEGHGRLKACQELGIEEVPIIRLDHLTDQQRKAYCLTHNKLTMNTGFDLDLLQAELDSIIDFDMINFGFFEEEQHPEEDKEVEEDDFEPQPLEEPISRVGQVYRLGRHRLIVGDSTDQAVIDKLMDGELADLVVTDPPYNVDIGIKDIEEAKIRRRRTDGLAIQNDAMTDEKFFEFLVSAFSTINNALKPGGVFYIWLASSTMKEFIEALEKNKLKVRQHLIWNKNTMILGRQDYQWKHEPCLYGWKDGAGHYFIDDRKQTTVIEDAKSLDFKSMKKPELIQLLEDIFADKVSTTVLDEKKPAASEFHPTMKPLKLIGRQVKNSSRPGERVLDTFGGSGSTLMVCEQLNRTCYTCELDPHYADVIIERWEQYTGEKAELVMEVEHATM